jgi:hypothetical protein
MKITPVKRSFAAWWRDKKDTPVERTIERLVQEKKEPKNMSPERGQILDILI